MLYLSRTNISKLQIIIHFLNIAVLGYFFLNKITHLMEILKLVSPKKVTIKFSMQ